MLAALYSSSYRCYRQLKEQIVNLDKLKPSVEYTALLRQCIQAKAFNEGRLLHARLRDLGYDNQTFLGNLLVQMYGSCASVTDARVVFDGLSQKNAFSWNIIVGAYAQNGYLERARSLFDGMPQHDIVSWNGMIAAYSRDGNVQEAKNLFDRMLQRDVVSWNGMIAAYAQNGQCREAFKLFRGMHLEGVRPNRVTVISVLDVCADQGALAEGRMVHAYTQDNELLMSEVAVGTALVHMYAKCGNLQDARNAFDRMPTHNLLACNAMITAYGQNGHMQDARSLFEKLTEKDIVSWNAMITANTQNGDGQEALALCKRMQLEGIRPDAITFFGVMNACTSVGAVGQSMSALIDEGGLLQSDFRVGTALVTFYGKCGRIEDARRVFDRFPDCDVVSFTAMIAAYAQHGHVLDARAIFDRMQRRNVVSWNAMLAAYTQNGHSAEAVELFKRMGQEGMRPNNVTFISILDACANLGALSDGKRVHSYIVEGISAPDVALENALLNMYYKCSQLEDALCVFNKMAERNVVSGTIILAMHAQNGHMKEAREVFDGMAAKDVACWNAMIASYVQNRQEKQAFELFRRMDMEGIQPDKVTFISTIEACTGLAGLAEAKIVHESVVESGFQSDVMVATALVNMFGKRMSLHEAKRVFEKMRDRDVVSWTTMIAVCAQNGEGKEALWHFWRMNSEALQPDSVTFLKVLFACSHIGLLKDGWQCFVSMSGDFGLTPTLDHYVCMVDVLGRAGQLDQAEELINSMPFEADALVWMTLLGACQIHGDAKRGARIAERAFGLDSGNASTYVLLSNILHASAGSQAETLVRKAMKDREMLVEEQLPLIQLKHLIIQILFSLTEWLALF